MRPNAATIAFKRAEIADRYRRKNKRVSMAALRISELQRIRRARYPQGIPDTPDGRVMVRVIVHHLAVLQGDQRRRINGWLDEHAPWLTLADANALMVEVATKPRRWRADRLAWRLKLIAADRKALRITTIGAIDVDKQARIRHRSERSRQIKAAARQAAGAVSRAHYEAQSLSREAPWVAQGISRATWYRRRETGPAAAYKLP